MEDGEAVGVHDEEERGAGSPALTVVLAAMAIVLLGVVAGIFLLLLRR